MPMLSTYKQEDEGTRPPPITPLATPALFFDMTNTRALAYLGQRVELFSNETMRSRADALRKTLEEGVREGESINQLTARIMDVYDGILQKRKDAQRIARTETIASLNAGSFDGYMQSNIPMDKFWVSTRDMRTRRPPEELYDHLSPDGQMRDLEEPFNISGELMMFPGDFSMGATAGNRINCRCTLRTKVRLTK